jgi:hypothetical protein
MKRPDSFEQKLQQQTRRQLPASWREEILAAAREAAAESGSANARPGTPHSSPRAGWRYLLANWLWPHPIAWGGLAASWALILALNLAARDPAASTIARDTTPASPQMQQLLREQEQMFAELLGPVEKSPAVEPRRRGAQPRSQARSQFPSA